MTRQQIEEQIASLQKQLDSTQDTTTTMAGTTTATTATPAVTVLPSTSDTSDKEQKLDELVQVAAVAGGGWLHSPQATNALAAASGIAPMFIHLGFMLAHMFQHHADKAGIPVPQLQEQK